MRFLTDENVATSVVLALRKANYDVTDVKEEGWFGQSDQTLIKFAKREQRIVLTHDKDFLYQQVVSVILLRFRDQQPHKVVQHLLTFLTTPQLDKRLSKPVIVILSEELAEFHR